MAFKVKVASVDIIEAVGEVELQLHSFLTFAQDEHEWSVSCPSCFTPIVPIE